MAPKPAHWPLWVLSISQSSAVACLKCGGIRQQLLQIRNYYTFETKSRSERNEKIGQQFSKVYRQVKWHFSGCSGQSSVLGPPCSCLMRLLHYLTIALPQLIPKHNHHCDGPSLHRYSGQICLAEAQISTRTLGPNPATFQLDLSHPTKFGQSKDDRYISHTPNQNFLHLKKILTSTMQRTKCQLDKLMK